MEFKRKHLDAEIRNYVKLCTDTGRMYYQSNHPDIGGMARLILRTIRPQAADGRQKVRIGGGGDGGYVMLDPGENGIAYSFGVAHYSPWDLEMAQRGFKVYQYDGSVENGPDAHPNLFFTKAFIGESPVEGVPAKTFRQILADNGHENERDIVLQIDIEGAEWDFFKSMDKEDMLRFSQIIVEFHDLDFSPELLDILEKMRETHTPVHVHNNNAGAPLLIMPDNFIYNGNLFEVTYARSRDYAFRNDNGYFPTPLDSPNCVEFPDIPLGYFDLLLDT